MQAMITDVHEHHRKTTSTDPVIIMLTSGAILSTNRN
jgi:hypothetical protein